jgi:hypothetical protein
MGGQGRDFFKRYPATMTDGYTLTISTRPVKLLLLAVALFFYLYAVHFVFMPVSIGRIITFIAWLYIGVRLVMKPRFPVDRGLYVIIILYMSYLYWVFLISGLSGMADISVLTSSVLFFLQSLLAGLFFSYFFHRFKLSFRDVILLVHVVIVLQAVFILVYFISWDFKQFIFTYLPDAGNIDYLKTLYRARGLSQITEATLSVVQSIGLLFTAYLVATVKYRSKQFLYLAFSFGLLVISIVLTGRTGLLMIPAVLAYIMILLVQRTKIPKNIIYFSLLVPVTIIIAYFLFRFVYSSATGAGDTDVFDRLLSWYAKEFYAGGELQSRTTAALMEHWFVPEDPGVFYFGDPSTWLVNRISSDVGVIRRWHSVGLVGTLLFYSMYWSIFVYMIFKCRGSAGKVMLFFLGVFLFLAETKEPFTDKIAITGFYMLLFSYLLTVKKDGMENKAHITGG